MGANWRRVCRPGHKSMQAIAIPGAPQHRPGFITKAWNYSKATAKWIAAGSPTRSDEEIARIFTICEACPNFSGGEKPHCNLCGCSLSKTPDGLRNKIRFSTEACPDNPPRWGDSPPA